MITTLIIDDNKIIREYFQTMIDWNSKGFELVSVASNGISGLQAFNKYHPQLVITDVQMPGMSGLELARTIRENAPETLIVFISNYENFSYVKGAMDVGAYDYILKHETRGAKFDEKLEKIKNHFEQYRQSKRSYLESKLILAFSSIGNPKLEQALPNRYSLIIFEQISLLPPFEKLTNTEIMEIDESVFQSYFSKNSDTVICGFRIKKYRYAVLLKPDCDVISFSERLCSHIYTQTKLRCYAMPIAEDQSVGDCLAAYMAKQEQIKAKFFSKHDCIIRTDKLLLSDIKKVSFDKDRVLSVLAEADISKACEILDQYAYDILISHDHDKLCLLTSTLLDFINQHSKNFSKKDFILYNENDMNFWTTADEILFWLKNKMLNLLSCLKQNPMHTYSLPVKKAIDYISTNYSNCELSVGDISDHVGLDANRLNKIMKDETGQTVIKWITNIRIERAKELLLQNKRLTQIYSDVGYTNISYFSNVFKKVCGVTPLEYRRNTLEK